MGWGLKLIRFTDGGLRIFGSRWVCFRLSLFRFVITFGHFGSDNNGFGLLNGVLSVGAVIHAKDWWMTLMG